ncbi:MAG: ATP-binding protein [Gammaproteobacteria bacterium]|nr:ATP-binding protein [Gammaproteobacteria bacterium]
MANDIPLNRELRDEEIIQIDQFLEFKDRSDPLVFVGRQTLIDHVIKQTQRLRGEALPESCAIVVRGAPGAGKTSLLKKIAQELSRTEQYHDVLVIELGTRHLNNPALCIESFMLGMDFKYAKNGLSREERDHWRNGTTGFVSHEEKWIRQSDSVVARLNSEQSTVWSELKRLLDVVTDHVFVVLVDEAQRIQPDRNSNVCEIACNLNDAQTQGIKILPVFAGLSDTRLILSKVGVSRVAEGKTRQDNSVRDFSLERLSYAESHRFMFDSLKLLGIVDVMDDEDRESMIQQCSLASDGWPRHLHHYLQSCVRHIKNCHDEKNLSLSLTDVLNEGMLIALITMKIEWPT